MDIPSGQRYVSLFHSNVFRFFNFAILKRDEWPKITETIMNYEDKEFLNSLWCYDACQDWFGSVQKNDAMIGFSWKNARPLGDFIDKVITFNH